MDKNREYWIARSLIKTKLTDKKIKKIQKELKKLYREVLTDMKKELAYLETNGGSDWEKYRAEGTIKSLESILDRAATEEEKILTDELKDLYNKIDEKDKAALGIDSSFFTVNEKLIEQVLKEEWSGLLFSERIWNRRDQVAIKLKEILKKGLIRGDSLQDMARLLAKEMDKDFNSAMRLVHTETANVQVQSTLNNLKELGEDSYEYLACPNKDACKICKELNGKVFKIEDAVQGVNLPPMHPHCHCDIMPVKQD